MVKNLKEQKCTRNESRWEKNAELGPLKMLEVVCLQVWLVLLINCLWTCMNMHQICMANLTPFSLVSVTSQNKPGLHSLHLQVWYYIYIYYIYTEYRTYFAEDVVCAVSSWVIAQKTPVRQDQSFKTAECPSSVPSQRKVTEGFIKSSPPRGNKTGTIDKASTQSTLHSHGQVLQETSASPGHVDLRLCWLCWLCWLCVHEKGDSGRDSSIFLTAFATFRISQLVTFHTDLRELRLRPAHLHSLHVHLNIVDGITKCHYSPTLPGLRRSTPHFHDVSQFPLFGTNKLWDHINHWTFKAGAFRPREPRGR